MLRTAEDDEEHVCLDFSDPNPRRGEAYGYDSFGVCLFSFAGQTIAEHTRSGVSDSLRMGRR